MILKQWFLMKQKEIKLRLTIFTMADTFMKEHKNIIRLASDIYDSLKDTPVEELQDKLITDIAKIATSQTNIEKESTQSSNIQSERGSD